MFDHKVIPTFAQLALKFSEQLLKISDKKFQWKSYRQKNFNKILSF